LRSITTRDAVWMLKGKGDGIYRVSGFGALSGFRVDQVDSSTYLLHPNLAVALDDVVWAWTNKGLVTISDAGVIPVNMPIAADTSQLETLLDHEDTTPGAFAVANPKGGEVIFGLPPTPIGTSAGAGVVFVYNATTRAFTKWFKSSNTTFWLSDGGVSCMAYKLDTRALWLGQTGTGTPRLERLESEDVVNADTEHAITVSAITVPDGAPNTANVTIVAGSTFAPFIGALVRIGSAYGIVIGTYLNDTEHFVVARTSGFATPGAGTAYEPYESTAGWRWKTADAAAVLKRFTELFTHWETHFGVYEWVVTLQREDLQGAGLSFLESAYTRPEADAQPARDHRALVPRTAALGSRLRPYLTVRQADCRWRVSGLTVGYEPLSSRVSR
jgi:hypothetical protein